MKLFCEWIKKNLIPKKSNSELKNLSLRHPKKQKAVLDNISFAVRGGEIVGIAGIEGNGQTELVECIAGLRKADSGNIIIEGKNMTEWTAKARRQEGLSHIPEDRYARGLVRMYTASMNSILGDYYHEPYAGSFRVTR